MATENLDEAVARMARYATATWGYQYLENASNYYIWQPETLCYTDVVTGKEVWVLVHAPDRYDCYSAEHCSAVWSHNGSRIHFQNGNTRTTANPAITGNRLWIVNSNGKNLRCCEGYNYTGFPSLEIVGWANTEEAFYALGDSTSRILYKYTPDSHNVITRSTILDLSSINSYTKQFVKLPVSGDDTFIAVRDTGGNEHSCETPNEIDCTEVYFIHNTGSPHVEGHWGIARGCGPAGDPYGNHTWATEVTFHDVWAIGPSHSFIMGQYSAESAGCFWTFDKSGSYADGGPQWQDYPFDEIRCECTGQNESPETPYPSTYFGHPAPDRWGRYVLVGVTEAEPQTSCGTRIWDFVDHAYLSNFMGSNYYDGQHHSWTGWTDYIICEAEDHEHIHCNKYTNSESGLYLVCYTHFPGYSGNYNGYPRPSQSPDGTKVAFATCWLNNSGDDYPYISLAVVYYPYPPEISGATKESGNVRIAWGPKKYTARGWPTAGDSAPDPREIAYYHVWISDNGTTGWTELTTTGVAFGTNIYDYAQAPSTTKYYSLTSEEYCNLESRRLGNVWKVTLDGAGAITESVQFTAYPADPGAVSAFWTTVPANPTSISVVKNPTAGHYSLSWGEPSDSKIRCYNVYYSEISTPSATQQYRIASIPVGVSSWLDWLAHHSAAHGYYRITSVDRYGNESGGITGTDGASSGGSIFAIV